MKYLGNVVNAYKIVAKDYLKPGMTVIDATCGNGNDALFLKQCITKSGKLYAIDIQKSAIESTTQLLKSNGFDVDENLIIRQCSHENLTLLTNDEPIDLIIYNLGYLPKGDKNITTLADTTLKSIHSALEHIKQGGLIFILCYRGHEQGESEFLVMSSFFESLSQNQFDVLKMEFCNQRNTPPVMWIVERK